MESIVLRPRKATEIVDAAIEVYRRNPLHFILLTSVVHVPWLILQIIFVGGGTATEQIFLSLLISLGTLMTYFFMSGLIVYMASELYLGRPIDAFETLRRIKGKLPRVFIASLLQSLAIAVGLLLLLFPAVWVSAVIFAVVPAIVLEGAGIGKAFQRSAQLSNGLKLHILSALGLVVILRFAIQFGVAILVTLISIAALKYVVASLVSILVYPIIGISDALIYYDARIRREGFDIEMMAAGSSTPQPAPG